MTAAGPPPRRVRVTGTRSNVAVPAGAVYVGHSAFGLPSSVFRNPFGLRRALGWYHPLRPCLDAALAEVLGDGAPDRLHCPSLAAGTRAVAAAAYRLYLADRPELTAAARRDLAGRDLAEWCPLPAAGEPDLCHAAVLLRVAGGAVLRPVKIR